MTQTDQDLLTKLSHLEKQLSQLEERHTWLTATAAQVKRHTAHLNGDRANLTREELGLILAEHKLNVPSASTVKRGLSDA